MQALLKVLTSMFSDSGENQHLTESSPQPLSSIFVSMFLLVLPLESLFHGLFHELGSSLGGTCVGYAVVIPTNYCRYETHTYRQRGKLFSTTLSR